MLIRFMFGLASFVLRFPNKNKVLSIDTVSKKMWVHGSSGRGGIFVANFVEQRNQGPAERNINVSITNIETSGRFKMFCRSLMKK